MAEDQSKYVATTSCLRTMPKHQPNAPVLVVNWDGATPSAYVLLKVQIEVLQGFHLFIGSVTMIHN